MEREDHSDLEMSLFCSVSAHAFALSTIDSHFLLCYFFLRTRSDIVFHFPEIKRKEQFKADICIENK